MQITPTSIPDVLVITPKIYTDDRGFFLESYHEEQYNNAGIKGPFIQDNHSGSFKGVLRGIHYQIKYPQGKLIRVIQGEIYDVAVDLRKSSTTFGQHVGEYISSTNHKQIWVPPGFGHGYLVLSDWSEVIYKVTDKYAFQWERTILWNDPDLNIKWPTRQEDGLLISEKDRHGKLFRNAEVYK